MKIWIAVLCALPGVMACENARAQSAVQTPAMYPACYEIRTDPSAAAFAEVATIPEYLELDTATRVQRYKNRVVVPAYESKAKQETSWRMVGDTVLTRIHIGRAGWKLRLAPISAGSMGFSAPIANDLFGTIEYFSDVILPRPNPSVGVRAKRINCDSQ